MAETFTLKALLTAQDRLSPALRTVALNAKTARKHVMGITRAMGKLTSGIGLPLTALSGLLGGMSVVGLKNAVVGFTQLAEAVHKGSLRSGMAVEQYQKMQYVGEQAGVSVEVLEGAMAKLNKQLGDVAADKNPALRALFQKIGIDARDANGNIRKAIDVLPQIANTFRRNENAAVRARMGVALLGKSWKDVLPLLVEGGEGLAQSQRQFDRLKSPLNAQQVKAAKDLGDQFSTLTLAASQVRDAVGVRLTPVINRVIDRMIAWAETNHALITSHISDYVEQLIDRIQRVNWKNVIQGTEALARSITQLVRWIGGTKNALIALAVVMNASTIVATFNLMGAIARASVAFAALALKAYMAGNAIVVSMLKGSAAMIRTSVIATALAGPMGMLSIFARMVGASFFGAGGLMKTALLGAVGAVRALGIALLANPLGIVLSLATAATLVYQHWDQVKTWFSSFFDWMGEKFRALGGWIKDAAMGAARAFGIVDKATAQAVAKQRPPIRTVAPHFGTQRVGASSQVPVSVQKMIQNRNLTAAIQPFPTLTQPLGSPGVHPLPLAIATQSPQRPFSGKPAERRKSLLPSAPAPKIHGAIHVHFNNAPPGMRVERVESKGSAVKLNASVGYRSFALGLP